MQDLPVSPEQTAPATLTSARTPAGLGRRLGAMGYDALLILGVVMLVHFPLVMALGIAVPRRMSWALWVLITVVFYTYFWVRHGRTLGMQAWRFDQQQRRHQYHEPQQRLGD